MLLLVLASAALVVGAAFVFAGTVGLLRFPDTHSRLHALTKADTLGLGFIVLGAALAAGSPAIALKLFIIWGLALVASSTVCYLIARLAKGTP
jgi:multicomponent Na+:H+ antiporter subunit G